jgi:hypothetical protein
MCEFLRNLWIKHLYDGLGLWSLSMVICTCLWWSLMVYCEPWWSEVTCGGLLPPCGSPQTVLTEIRAWLDTHPREVVILSFSHFLGLNQELHMLLITAIRAAFATKLCPKTVSKASGLRHRHDCWYVFTVNLVHQEVTWHTTINGAYKKQSILTVPLVSAYRQCAMFIVCVWYSYYEYLILAQSIYFNLFFLGLYLHCRNTQNIPMWII